ncbi:MAG: FkbM family methyltransferase [Luteitalea sp.]|nr:FkbM family methyltransferase [Luteitalea sp.]
MDERDLRQTFDQLYQSYFGEAHLEQGAIESLPRILESCDLFLDVGASLGMYTYYADKLLKGKKIIAIEADPDRFAELEKNCAKWQGDSTNEIVSLNASVGDRAGTATFYKTGSTISGALFQIEERSQAYEAVEVQEVTLDELFEPAVKIVAKIDVEGAEYRVLQGARKHLDARNTDFLIELHWWGDRERGTTSMDVLRCLFEHRMAMIRPAKQQKSHYLFRPARAGELLWPPYIRFAPLLFAKSMYGKHAPRQVREIRERIIKARRKKVFGVTGDRA